jgi:hypothetical protein
MRGQGNKQGFERLKVDSEKVLLRIKISDIGWRSKIHGGDIGPLYRRDLHPTSPIALPALPSITSNKGIVPYKQASHRHHLQSLICRHFHLPCIIIPHPDPPRALA